MRQVKTNISIKLIGGGYKYDFYDQAGCVYRFLIQYLPRAEYGIIPDVRMSIKHIKLVDLNMVFGKQWNLPKLISI